MDRIIELEKELIGIFFLKPSRIDEFVLPLECFNDKTNRIVAKFVIQQWKEHKSIDNLSLIENYQHLIEKEMKIADFNYAVAELAMVAPTDANFEYLQETIFNYYKKSQTLLKLRLFENNKISYGEMIEAIHKIESKKIFEKGKKITGEEIFNIVSQKKKRFSFEYKNLSYFANIQEHDFVILAARPGIGKTGLALNLCSQLSMNYKTIYFSMEMSERQIYSRLLSIQSHIDMKFLDNPKTDYQKTKIKEYAYELAKQKLQIFYSNQTLQSIKTKIIQECREEHVVVFIDYVGLITPTKKYVSSYEKITDIVKELRYISLDYNCTIFLISQLNRQGTEKPKLSDLKDSGELEQAGTTVLLLSRENSESTEEKEFMKLEIAKNRNGRTGMIDMIYNKANQIFEEVKR